MIPKTIHYCWFGRNPLPPLAIQCIESWKKYFPDYEIKEWNEDNFDVNMISYTSEAYQAKKYAFVSDYARFWILYNYGGIYFDTDVEIIRPMNDIIKKGPFMGCESTVSSLSTPMINPGVGLGCNPNHILIKRMLDLYATLSFVSNNNNSLNYKTIVEYTTETLIKYGLISTNKIQLIEGFYIYPNDYFNPINIITKRLHITDNTRSIHHFAASWVKPSLKRNIKNTIRKIIPEKILLIYNSLKNKK